MEITLMRRLDFWLGVPLCFLIKIIDCILKLFFVKKKKTNLEKFLFIKLSEMGAIILALPLLTKTKRNNPKADFFFLTFKKNLCLLEALDILPPENIFVISENSFLLFLIDSVKTIIKIRRNKIGIVFDLEFFSRFTSILTYFSNAEKKVGFYRYSFEGLYRGNFLTHKIQYNPSLHMSEMYLFFSNAVENEEKLIPELVKNIDDEECVLPGLNLPFQIRKKAWNKLESFGIRKNNRLILINPGDGKLPLREWPIENFVTLSNLFLEDDKSHIIIAGAEGGSKKAYELIHRVNNKRCVNLAGKTNMFELFSLFEEAAILIANDCGLAHLASLTSVRKIVFFGPETPDIFKPLDKNTHIVYSNLPCSPCFSVLNHRVSTCTDNQCLKIIKPREIYSLTEKIMTGI